MQFPIMIGLHRSRILAGLVAISAIVAAAALSMLPRSTQNLPVFWLLWLFACLLAIHGLRPVRYVIRLERSGSVSLQNGPDTVWEEAKFGATLFVHPWLTVFRLQTTAGAARTIVVTVDSLPAEDFRRLRVFLRWRLSVSAPDDGA
ncbi:MAG: hypothetical protein E6Q42_08330 [Dechloromonas sp.]|nr:MAG: hypothetical protein E6Q42_08330 [Dechloromonas sp.]